MRIGFLIYAGGIKPKITPALIKRLRAMEELVVLSDDYTNDRALL